MTATEVRIRALLKDQDKRIADLEAELSNARSQGLENEKELVTLRLELQELAKKFEEHAHSFVVGESFTRKPRQ